MDQAIPEQPNPPPFIPAAFEIPQTLETHQFAKGWLDRCWPFKTAIRAIYPDRD
ncbi:MAG: hypothetical protein O3A14_12930 [Cyanobacteria bacterium]|nr:hypothetical protein [Cyanobacteriota bacterium]